MRFFLICLFLLLILIQTGIAFFNLSFSSTLSPIKVGLVHSHTGFRASREKNVHEATLLAIAEINKKGGIRGREIIPISRDPKSSVKLTREEIEDLILKENVDVIFGCWNLGSRLDFKELFEKHHHLLISPYQYEGIISSPNIVNIGASANQQMIPTIYYCMKNIGRRFFLIGSDYMFPHIINAMIRDQVSALQGEILGEVYLTIGSHQIEEAIKEIIQAKPDVILSSIMGQDNQVFFHFLKKAEITAEQIPVFSLSLTDTVIENFNREDIVGHYATWNYFQSLDSEVNQEFVQNFRKFSNLMTIDNAAEAGYFGVYLWAKAVEEAKTTNIQDVTKTLQDMQIEAPEGLIIMDIEGNHAWKYTRIGKIGSNGKFDIVWQSKFPIRPIPYQTYRSKLEWSEFMEKLYPSIDNTSFHMEAN
jgi:urea transport system substrate-binding protein